MKLKPSHIIGLVITLLLLGIILPIGLDEITSYTADNKTETSSYTSQSISSGAIDDNYNITLYSGQELNVSVDYTDSEDLINLTIYNPSGAVFDSDSTANATLTIEKNATTYGVYQVNITAEDVIGTATYNLTLTIITFIDSDLKDRIETLVGSVIPIIAVIGIIMYFVRKQDM